MVLRAVFERRRGIFPSVIRVLFNFLYRLFRTMQNLRPRLRQ